MSEDVFKLIFSKNLRYYMSQEGKTQIDIVNDLGINKSSISSWVNGTRLPRMDKIEMLAQYLGVSRTDLIEERKLKSKGSASGSNLVLTPEEELHILNYRCLDAIDKAAVDAYMESRLDSDKYVGEGPAGSEAG